MKTRIWLPLTIASSLLGAAPAAAQEAAKNYPSRPIRMIVPNAPGSSVDTLSRIVGNKLGDVVGQQIVIDNRAGAAGVIAMEIAKSANPDGYTLISATTAASTIARLLQKNPTFHPVTDYDYVLQFAETANHSVTYSNTPGDSLQLAFEGRGIRYIYTRAANRGLAEVSIDGRKRGQINLFSAETKWQSSTLFDGLAEGRHVFEIRVLDGYVDLDAVAIMP